MKGIDFKRWKNSQSIIDVYDDIINLAYSQNYNLLNRLNRMNEDIQRNNNGKSGLLGIGVSEAISKAEFKVARDIRNEYYKDVMPQINETYRAVSENYFELRKLFCMVYTAFYGTDKSFNECFDGFLISDDRFSNDLYDLQAGKISDGDKVAALIELMNFFTFYSNYVIQFMKCTALKELIETLNGDFISDGYKSMFFGKERKDIALISKNEIDELVLMVKRKLSELDKLSKSQLHKTKKVYKKSLKQRYYRTQFPEIEDEYKKYADTEWQRSGLLVIKKIVDSLKNRYDYANEYFDTNDARRSVDIFENIISLGTRSPKLVDSVYYHRAEICLLEQYSRIFPEINEKIKRLVKRAGGEKYLLQFISPESELETDGITGIDGEVLTVKEVDMSGFERQVQIKQRGDDE